ncbi:MAG: orotidine-5'-phosphate decarboxylase [Rhodospirillales bacterium]|nr:orotidine-5'-phosphate decarboxylase [Rhodospirillales bacterium]
MPSQIKPTDRIFVALDTTDIELAVSLAQHLAGLVGGVKMGKEFLTAFGPDGVRRVSACGMPVFLDTKFHDIPNTVASAIRAALPLQPFMINIHASGGRAMMEAARDAVLEAESPRPLLIAVTVLTSLSDQDLDEIGLKGPSQDRVVALAKLTQSCGLDGVVCSPLEIAAVRQACGPDFKLVVPGIRPTWAAAGDQKRIMTPRQAVDLGADYLVIGRPITGADDPVAAAKKIAEELA